MTRGQEIERAFRAFHRENPHVYSELRRLAVDLVAVGHQRIGIGMLFEVLRWQRALHTVGDAFKLNNSHRAFYARMLMDREPRLRGVFETRTAAADADRVDEVEFDAHGQGVLA